MTREILLLLVGGVVGAVISSVWQSGERRVLSAAKSALSERRTRRSQGGDLARLAVERFVDAGLGGLYETQLVAPGTVLPYLLDDDVDLLRLTAQDEVLFHYSGQQRDFEVSRRAVRWFERRGARLFDGEILFVQQRRHAEDGLLEYQLGRTRYFSYLTRAWQIGRSLSGPSNRLRKIGFEEFPAGMTGTEPVTVSLAATSLFVGGDGGSYVAMSRRSSAVAASPGARSLLPMCSLESNTAGEECSRFSLLVFNFVREFCEEFFDQRDLIDTGSGQRAHPDWFLGDGVPSQLEEMLGDGRLTLWVSGVGLSVVDGGLKISIVARFDDPGFFDFVMRGAHTNWETVGRSAEPSLQFLRIDDDRWDEWTVDGSLSRTSAFALDRARLFLAEVASGEW